jgi:penicillin amidase
MLPLPRLPLGARALFISALALSSSGCGDDGPKRPPGEVVELEGLGADVSVAVDEDSVPHLRCATAADCAAGLGYLHARDRFFQMEVRRDFVRGRLHRIVRSDAVVPIDQANRATYLTRDARPIEEVALEQASPETRAMLEAYARGVNTWLAEARAEGGPKFSDEAYFLLIDASGITDWTAEDSIASVVALVDSLTNSSAQELALGALADEFPADLYGDLLHPRPVSNAKTLFGAYSPAAAGPDLGAQLALSRTYGAALREAARSTEVRDALLGRTGDRGSNNWVVGPSLSKSGNALLSNDPHLGHTNPATWYLVEMEAGDDSMHVAGVSFAGLPWVVLGQNEHIAWGATTTYFDQADVYLETLNAAGDAVIFDGEEVPLLTYDTSITVGSKEYPGTAYVVPHHGPLLSIDEAAGTAVSLKWTGAELSTDVNFLTEMMAAATVDEAREAAELITTLGQNWVVIDTAGHFGWFPYNRVPTRDGVGSTQLPSLPLPGDGSAEWTGYVPYDALPQLYDNPEGYIATANNDMTGQVYDGDPTNDGIPVFQTLCAPGLREERIKELLEATDQHTTDTMLATVGDTYVKLSEYVLPGLEAALDAASGDVTEAKAVVDALAAWDRTCPTGLASSDPEGPASTDAAEREAATQCLIFHRLLGDLRENVFGDELLAASPDTTETAALAALTDLLTGSARLSTTAYWDDVSTEGTTETPEQIIAASVGETLAWIESKLGADRSEWLWGRLHRITLHADLFSSLGISKYDNGPYAVRGGYSTVNVATPSQDRAEGFDIGAGASMRLTCEGLPEGMSCQIQLPGGQRHDRDSPYYQNFLERWLTNTPAPLRFGVELEAPVESFTFVAPR